MFALWVILITGVLVAVYLCVLVRAANRREAWALDALKAMSCISEGSSAAWFRMVEEPEAQEPTRQQVLVA
jgi:hypothetical protein